MHPTFGHWPNRIWPLALHSTGHSGALSSDWFEKIRKITVALMLALVLVELQNTCKKKLNRKTLKQPKICYIFEKLRVQGCQIGHSHVSIQFNSAPAHSTHPHNVKKHRFRQNSWKLSSQKLLLHAHFLCNSRFSFFPILFHSQGHIWAKMSQNVTPLTPKIWPKMAAYEPKRGRNALWKIAEPPT